MIRALGDQTTHPDAPQTPRPGAAPGDHSSADPSTELVLEGHRGLTALDAAATLGLELALINAAAADAAAAGTLDHEPNSYAGTLDPEDIFNDIGEGFLIPMPVYDSVAQDSVSTATHEFTGVSTRATLTPPLKSPSAVISLENM